MHPFVGSVVNLTCTVTWQTMVNGVRKCLIDTNFSIFVVAALKFPKYGKILKLSTYLGNVILSVHYLARIES